MDLSIWSNIPTELYVHVIKFIPDPVIRRDLGLKPRKMLSIPNIDFPRVYYKDVEEIHQDRSDNFKSGKTVHITSFPRYFFFELFDGQQLRQIKFDRASGKVKNTIYEDGEEEELWDKANANHTQIS